MSKNKIKSIGDLVHVPAVETVIQLTDADSSNLDKSSSLLSSFVLTDEIERAFGQIFERISKSDGVGVFLKGNYGSGKSHFLAVLSLLLESDASWNFITHPLLKTYSPLQKQTILVVKIALHNYSSDASLERIVFDETENAFAAAFDRPILFQNSAVMIEQFNRYILPHHNDFLKSGKRDSLNWEQFCKKHTGQAAEQISRFLQKNKIELKTPVDRRLAMETIRSEMEKEGISGIFYAVDELSEFLKSKNNSAVFSEDLRFLQFMGESCKQNPIYFIATLQENIEQTGYIEDDLVYRIKDRFPFRFTLSAQHVNQLISNRLIQKKKNTKDTIDNIYKTYQTSFPNTAIQADSFFDIYPVHPATINLLEGLTPIFSQHRGVVDFIYHQMTGDSNRSWKGMLSLPSEQLMTPDVIFDHFRERIKEHPDLNAYSEVVFRTLEKEIPTLFYEEADVRIALKIIKILILVEISPIEKRPTIQTLAEMVNEPVSDVESGLNAQYLEDVILGKLIKEGSFVNRGETDAGEEVFFISLEQTIHQLLRSRIQEISKKSHSLKTMFEVCLPCLQNTLIPFTLFSGVQRRRQRINWQNTQRSGWIYFKPNLNMGHFEVESIMQQMKSDETDFALFIGGLSEQPFPVEPQFGFESLKGRFAASVFGWIPRVLKRSEKQFLQRFYAYVSVEGSLKQDRNPQERQMQIIVKEWLEKNNHELSIIIEDAYFGGRLINHEGWVPFKFALIYIDFKHIVQQLTTPVFQKLFPRHSEIMPGDVIQPFVIEKLFMHFIHPGKLSKEEAKTRHIDNLIRSVLSPLEMVADNGEEWILSTNFKENCLGGALLSACEKTRQSDLFSLYWQFRKSEWGVTKPHFNLLLSALISSGRLVGFQSGNVVSFRTTEQLFDGSIDAVGAGELIAGELQKALNSFRKSKFFEDIPEHFSAAVQEQFWRRMKQYKEHIAELIYKQTALLKRYEGYPLFQNLSSIMEPNIGLLTEFENSFRTSYSATKGLEKLAMDLGLNEFSILPEEVKKLENVIDLMENKFSELNQIYSYIYHPNLDKTIQKNEPEFHQSFSKLYAQLEDGNFTTDSIISDFSRQYYSFKNDYAQWYGKEHEHFYAAEVFTLFRKIESEPALQLLKRLHKLETVVASPDWITIQDLIFSLQKPCQRRMDRQLMTSPFCECGFLPGSALPESAFEEIKDKSAAGIESILTQLQSTYRWAVEEYINNLTQVGDSATADSLESILNLSKPKTENNYSQFILLFTDKVLAAIDAAIKGKVLILQRQVNTLMNKLAGKQMVLEDVRNVFEEWLTEGEEISAKTHIRIVSEQELPALEIKIYSDAKSAIREEGFRFYETFWLMVWAQQHRQETWLDWITERYRCNKENISIINGVAEKLSRSDDKSKMAMYFEREGILKRLEKLVDIEKMNRRELMEFILKESFFMPLSLEGMKTILNTINPTEPLNQETNHFYLLLKEHPHVENWAHLQNAVNYFETLTMLNNFDTAENPMAHFLEKGWVVSALLSEIKQKNDVVNLVKMERLELLEKKAAQWQQKLIMDKNPIRKKELSLPYITINDFPKRLMNKLSNPPVVMLIVDAMRWDVWEKLKPLFEKSLSNHMQTYLAAMEVASPTTTEENRPLLLKEVGDACGALDWYFETVSEKPEKQEEIISQLQSKQEMIVLNTTIVDAQLHTHSDPLTTMLDVITTRMEALICPLLRKISSQSTIVITADHGFTVSQTGYIHGGDSYFEKIVPFAVWESEGN